MEIEEVTEEQIDECVGVLRETLEELQAGYSAG